jgi:hypothetical protein
LLKQNNVYYCAIDAVSGKGCYLSWKIQMFGWKCGQWSSKWFHLLAVLILTTQHVRKSWNAHHKIISQHLPRIHYLFSKYSNHISEQCFWLENQDTTPEINSYGNPPVYTVELGNWSIFQPGLIKPEGVWNPQLGLSKMFGEKLGEDKKNPVDNRCSQFQWPQIGAYLIFRYTQMSKIRWNYISYHIFIYLPWSSHQHIPNVHKIPMSRFDFPVRSPYFLSDPMDLSSLEHSTRSACRSKGLASSNRPRLEKMGIQTANMVS